MIEEIKFKVGDVVQIKSTNWYNENKNSDGDVCISPTFIKEMSKYCGKLAKIIKIAGINRYRLDIDNGLYSYSSDFFEKIPCDFCKGDDINDNGIHFGKDSKGMYVNEHKLNIKFCPMCGELLNQ